MMFQQQEKTLSQIILESAGITHKTLLDRLDRMVEEAEFQHKTYWEIKDLVRETTYCKASLEKFVLCDPRIKALEGRFCPGGKRVWESELIKPILKELLKNNNY